MQRNNQAACTCIIPFYNENLRIISIIESLTRLTKLAEIICVDDGSVSSAIADEIEKKFPSITLIGLEKNGGKSAAVYAGMLHVKTPYVMLMDADLDQVVAGEIESAINIIINNPAIDMIIFRRISNPWFSKIARVELLFSGERILRVTDLENIFKTHPRKYQLEIAINFYMMEHKKNVFWVPYSTRDNLKIHKRGLVKGLMQELTMFSDIFKFRGSWPVLKSLFYFCRKEYSKPRFSYWELSNNPRKANF